MLPKARIPKQQKIKIFFKIIRKIMTNRKFIYFSHIRNILKNPDFTTPAQKRLKIVQKAKTFSYEYNELIENAQKNTTLQTFVEKINKISLKHQFRKIYEIFTVFNKFKQILVFFHIFT